MDCRTQLANMAIMELDKGDFLTATKMLNTSIRLEPNNHELYFERSICHHKLGDYQASLDDANSAIRLNSTDFNIFYQRGLALLGLNMLPEAVTSFKKAIELRAKQDDSKLSDIFKLLRDAINELNTARRGPTALGRNQQARSDTVPTPTNQSNQSIRPGAGTNNDHVDSTTGRPQLNQQGTSSNHQNLVNMKNLAKDSGNSNLVATNRNNQPICNSIQIVNGNIGTNRVSSSASHMNNLHTNLNNNTSPDISSANVSVQHMGPNLIAHNHGQDLDANKSGFDWNIRRSERIFLHHTSEPGTSGPQYGILTRHDPLGPPIHQRQKTSSNPSSITSGTKRPHDSSERQTYQPTPSSARSREGTGSQVESDVDVDDSQSNSFGNVSDSSSNQRRLMVAPSSSMPAVAPGPPSSTLKSDPSATKDDSYSSRYKRLRRDRERARRGTSKLCTIKPSDLDDLLKSHNSESTKRFMRVIAPIDGWLWSGQLSVDDSSANTGSPQYAVKLDGDTTGSSYFFSQETVLNDVIKEVRVKSVSELRKGARICCYWSRQYKCLSTGVVTSRTFEATKSLVSVKYDNGDLSALPLEDLRLLPPDYPKYMSNCDPLLLARNGDGAPSTATSSNGPNQVNNNQNVIESQPSVSSIRQDDSMSLKNDDAGASDMTVLYSPEKPTIMNNSFDDSTEDHRGIFREGTEIENGAGIEDGDADDDEDATIPPTDETIEFITSENNLNQHEERHRATNECVERVSIVKDGITSTNDTQVTANNNSRASSEENNYGFEYRPWIFNGEPKRCKRNGRTYKDCYTSIRRGNEIIQIGDSAELMPLDESILPFIAKIDSLWATSRGEMRVRVRWYYRLNETKGEPYELKDGENALFETNHIDENDVQSIYRSTKILSWTEYCKHSMGHVNNNNDNSPKTFYLAGSYDPVEEIKHLRADVKEAQ